MSYKKRLESRRCCAPAVISCHHRKNCKVERHLSALQVTSVFEKTGIVLPVGIGLCAQCRKNMLKNRSPDVNHETHHIHSVQNIDSTGEGPSIKRRRLQSQNVIVSEEHDYDSSQNIEYSQGTETEILSQASNASYIHTSRLESLNSFLSVCGLSPVKELRNTLAESSDRTKQRYTSKARQCVNAMLDTMCPNESHAILMSIVSSSKHDDQDEPSIQILKEIYLNAETWQFRRQVLSILTQQMTFAEAEKCIPGLTSWRYYEAKKHAAEIGVGLPLPAFPLRREKISTESLEHFIDFITSSHIIKDLPFGQKTLKMESGEIVAIPNVVRSLTSSTLINQYFQLCEEDNISPIGKSTLYKILDNCPASVRKSIEGLDNYVMEGSRAFQTLEEILTIFKEDDLKRKLTEAKRYLKTDFKVHVAENSCVQDHCMGYALSLSKKEFQCVCDHQHTQRCCSCMEMDDVLKSIKDFAENTDMPNKDSVHFKVDKSLLDIKDLQKHILRSKNQERARPSIVDDMVCGDVLITCDWAMKFLPRKFREGQMDWYAKRGINGHVSVSLIKTLDTFQTTTHIHLFTGQTPQDSAFTVAVLCDVVRDLEQALPCLKKVHFFSDNAGCYKSSLSLTTLQVELGTQQASYNFCEAQNGKGPCDRRASHAKAAIKRYINEGRDVTTAEDMKKALDKVPNGSFKVKVVDGIYDLETEKSKASIPSITSYYNFNFEDEGIRMWQAYGIGEGKLIKWKDLSPTRNHVHLKNVSSWTEENDALYSNDQQKQDKSKPQYFCPKDGCIREFRNQQSMDHHMLKGNCEMQLQNSTLTDRVKILYSKKLSVTVTGCTTLNTTQCSSVDNDDEQLSMGWAFKSKKKKDCVFHKTKRLYDRKIQRWEIWRV